MLHALIMAGGTGTRFWPESRNARPKQLLKLTGDRSMIQLTVDRLSELVTPDRTLIVTNQQLVEPIAEQLPELPRERIVGEPCKRDTAPCIGLAALMVSRNDPDATMVVLPADHVIEPVEAFHAAIRQAVQLVEQSPGRIVTFGIKPTYPAEIYGYIEAGEPLATTAANAAGQAAGSAPAFVVRQFREKPDAATARRFLEQGNFYWNSGIFVWKAATILQALRQHQPEMYAHLEQIGNALGTPDFPATFEREFAAIKGVSIDYAVMEHATDVAVIEAPFTWDDVGSWRALSRLKGTDDAGHTVLAKRYIGIDSQRNIIRSEGDHLIVTLGLNDCIVVHTKDATLVASKEHEESIRQIVKELEQRNWYEHL